MQYFDKEIIKSYLKNYSFIQPLPACYTVTLPLERGRGGDGVHTFLYFILHENKAFYALKSRLLVPKLDHFLYNRINHVNKIRRNNRCLPKLRRELYRS